MSNPKWNETIETILWMVRTHETMPTAALTIKLSEELGEFSEIMLHELGYLHHKDKVWKDTPIEEGADIINVLLGALAQHYPDKTPTQLSNELHAAMVKKGRKYGRLIGADDDIFT